MNLLYLAASHSQHHVRQEASTNTVSNGVAEGHHGDGQEGRDGNFQVSPVNLSHLGHHQETNDHQSRRGRLVGNHTYQRGNEHRQEEQAAGNHTGQTSTGTFTNTGGGLNIRGVGGNATHTTSNCG